MKKNILTILGVLLAIVMLFALASCVGKDKGNDIFETTGTSFEKETEKEETPVNSAETSKTSGNIDDSTTGVKQNETTSITVPDEEDTEVEYVIPSTGIELPIVKP